MAVELVETGVTTAESLTALFRAGTPKK